MKRKIKWTHQYSTRNLPCRERMRKHGSDDPIDCKSCGCHLETDDHLFQCPRRPQFLRRIQSIIDEVRDKLDPCLYFLLKHHLTAYISGDDPIFTTALALTHERRVSRPHQNRNLNPYVDSVPHRPHLIHNPYILETEYPYEEYHQLLMEQQHIGWDNFLRGKLSKQWRIYQLNYEKT